jgi:hypothetical protein
MLPPGVKHKCWLGPTFLEVRPTTAQWCKLYIVRMHSTMQSSTAAVWKLPSSWAATGGHGRYRPGHDRHAAKAHCPPPPYGCHR